MRWKGVVNRCLDGSKHKEGKDECVESLRNAICLHQKEKVELSTYERGTCKNEDEGIQPQKF